MQSEIHSAPKVSSSSLSHLPLSFSVFWHAWKEAIGRIFPSYYMWTFSEFPTSHLPAQQETVPSISRRLSQTSVLILERSEEGREQISALKTESVASKEQLYTSSPDSQPNHTSQCHWRSVLCQGNLWHWALGCPGCLGSRACICRHPKRNPAPAPPVLTYDVEILHFFFPQNCSVICWISSAQDSHVFNQPRLLLRTVQTGLTQMVSQAWPPHPNQLRKYSSFGTILSLLFHRAWKNNLIQVASSGWQIRILIHDQNKYKLRYS